MEMTPANIKFSTLNELADFIRQKFTPSQQTELIELIQQPEPEEYDEPTKEQLIEEIKEAVREVNLAKAGKIRLKTAEEFLNEL
jgi:cobalamin biosynthesis Mg chelatase CobN